MLPLRYQGGGWQLYGVGVLITAIFTLVTTLAANMSIYALVLVRIIEGVIEEQAGRARVRRSIESCRLTCGWPWSSSWRTPT